MTSEILKFDVNFCPKMRALMLTSEILKFDVNFCPTRKALMMTRYRGLLKESNNQI